MKAHWRSLINLLPLRVQQTIYSRHFQKTHKDWLKCGKRFPPSHFSKQEHLKTWAAKNDLKILIETGTYLGDMVFALQDDFDKIISIELAEIFYKKAIARFKGRSHIHILFGDSGKKLNEVVPGLSQKALIWLDGHYSGGLTAKGEKECPVYEELDHIFKSGFDHTILIDDARLFVGKNDYPTIEALKNYVLQRKPSYHFLINNDAIIITPKM